jgi:predicted dehydrogenase
VSSKLKVAVIGVGGIARTHMPGWEASEHAEVVAVSDIFEPVARTFAETYRIGQVYTNPADIFADPDIDIVDICTPNMSHADLSIAALNAGKHVICEKPLAPTPGEIRRMIAARDASGKTLMTAQHFRFSGASQAMKREIDAGALGDIYHARSWMLRRGWIPVRPGFIYKKNSGGGPCIDIGVHILDLTLWFMGNPKPVTVSGVAKRALSRHEGAFSQWGGTLVPDDMDVEDFASAFVRFDNGATLILEVSWLIHHNTPGEDMQMWLYGMEGGALWPKGEFTSTNYATKQFRNSTITLMTDKMEPHALECVEFARAIVDGAPSPVPAEQSLDVMSILDGIYRSQSSGREVAIERE